MRCPFCNAELARVPNTLLYVCKDKLCVKYWDCLHLDVWRQLWIGKNAQELLKDVANWARKQDQRTFPNTNHDFWRIYNKIRTAITEPKEK